LAFSQEVPLTVSEAGISWFTYLVARINGYAVLLKEDGAFVRNYKISISNKIYTIL
jgi:hypothetical protein